MNKILLTTLIVTSMGIAHAGPAGHGGKKGAPAHWMSPKEDAAKPNPIKSDTLSVERGKKSYFQNCSSCHGATAKGDGPAGAAFNPKPTNLFAMSGGHPDGDFAWKIANGRGAMPAWKFALNENQIWDLVNYIQQLNPNPNKKKMDMSKMDHSNMSKDDLKKMMGNMGGKAGHANSDGHHDANPKPKPKVESNHDDNAHGH